MVQGAFIAAGKEKKQLRRVLGETGKPTEPEVDYGSIPVHTTNTQNDPQPISESIQVRDNSILEEEIDKRRGSWGYMENYQFKSTGCAELPKGSITEKEYTKEQNSRLFEGEHKREEPDAFTVIGNYRYHVYPEEQQERLNVNEDGNVVDEENEGQEHLPIFERRKHWTAYQTTLFNKYGSSEEPTGKTKTFSIKIYTEDQQRRLQLDCFGAFTGINEFPRGKVGRHNVYTSEQQKRLAIDEDGNPVVVRILAFVDSAIKVEVEEEGIMFPINTIVNNIQMEENEEITSNIDGTEDQVAPLNFYAATELFVTCQSKLSMHQLTHEHLSFRQYWIFTIPIAILTMISGIMAFLASSEMFSANTNTILSATVGCLAAVGGFFQSLSGSCKYGERATMHLSASEDLKALCDNLELLQTEASQMSQDDRQKAEHIDTIATIRSKYQQCIQGCKSEIPLRIDDAYKKIDSEMAMTWTRKAKDDLETGEDGINNVGHILMEAAYHEVATQITCSFQWPMYISGEINAIIKISMDNIRKKKKSGATFWK